MSGGTEQEMTSHPSPARRRRLVDEIARPGQTYVMRLPSWVTQVADTFWPGGPGAAPAAPKILGSC